MPVTNVGYAGNLVNAISITKFNVLLLQHFILSSIIKLHCQKQLLLPAVSASECKLR